MMDGGLNRLLRANFRRVTISAETTLLQMVRSPLQF
jgi:hypothetical protein